MPLHRSPPLLPSKRKLDSPPPSPPRRARNPPSMIQFFVRAGARSLVLRACPDDTVAHIQSLVHTSTGIPPHEQRFTYSGRHLNPDLTLAACGVAADSCLQLTGRMRSARLPRAWTLADEIVSWVRDALDGRPPGDRHDALALVRVLLSSAAKSGAEAEDHLKVFVLSGAAAALVMLYLTQPFLDKQSSYRNLAYKCILLFVHPDSELLPRSIERYCMPVLFEFCRLFRDRVDREDSLYGSCRQKLGAMLEPSGVLYNEKFFPSPRSENMIKELLPYALELGSTLHQKILKSLEDKLSPHLMCSHCEVLREFSDFVVPLSRAMAPFVKEKERGCEYARNFQMERWLATVLHMVSELMGAIDQCLKTIEDEFLNKEGGELSECQCLGWTFFLSLLTELNGISEIFKGEGDQLKKVLLERRVALNALLSRAKRNIKFQWFLQLKDVINFEAKRNLVLMLFPEEKEDYIDMHEMLIDRSNLLAESFEYISSADPTSLRNNIFMEFKNEDATGPGVLREWFYLLGQAIFNPQNVLFSPCAHDRTRFFPNPTSSVDPLHLQYFGFCGRIIALALKHRVHIGVFFDRVFFQQLAGERLSLEDIVDADPVFYRSWKSILEMDADIIDSDALGLTFAREVEVLGTRKLVELCPGGKQIVVNSKNRNEYVDLLIHHCFVSSTTQQVAQFAQGFADIISSPNDRLFFQSLCIEEFNRMLGGKEGGICVEDWKVHTEYKGYRKNDRQIKWFWKVVQEMTSEQHGVLVTFWTSLRHLPSEGFRGLPSKLYIHRSSSSSDHLPTSHTCFYQLCLPIYPSLKIMRERLQWITQEHVGSSFGRW